MRIWPKGGALIWQSAEDQRGVGAPESEGVGKNHIDLALLGVVRHETDRRLHRGIVEIDRRRRDAVTHGENREDRLDRAGGAQQMSDRGLGRGHAHAAGGIADEAVYGGELDLV